MFKDEAVTAEKIKRMMDEIDAEYLATLDSIQSADVYKSALEIILALCKKVEFKTSETITVMTICETVLKEEV